MEEQVHPTPLSIVVNGDKVVMLCARKPMDTVFHIPDPATIIAFHKLVTICDRTEVGYSSIFEKQLPPVCKQCYVLIHTLDFMGA